MSDQEKPKIKIVKIPTPPRDDWPNVIDTTCVDCGAPITWKHVEDPRICDACRYVRQRNGVAPCDAEPHVMTRYAMIVELVWPITAKDVAYRAYGDAEIDFANRSKERVRDALQQLVCDGAIDGFCFGEQPRRIL